MLVLVAAVAFGCSDTVDGPDPGDAQRTDDPGAEDAATRDPTSDQAWDDGSDPDEGGGNSDDEARGQESNIAGTHLLSLGEFRARWNDLVGATDDGGGQSRLLAMGELQPVGDGDIGAALGDGAGSDEGAATVTTTLNA